MVQPLWKPIWSFLQKWKLELPDDWLSYPTSVYPSKRIENRIFKSFFIVVQVHLDYHAYCSIIHNSWEANTLNIHQQINVICIWWNIIQPSKKREILPCYNMHEPWERYSKSNKTVTKGQILMIPFYKVSDTVKLVETESSKVVARCFREKKTESF